MRGFRTHFTRLRDGFGPQCSCRCVTCLDSFIAHRDCRSGCRGCDAFDFEPMGDLQLNDVNFDAETITPLCELAERHAVKKAIIDNRRRAQRGLGPKPVHGRGAREMCAWALRGLFTRAVKSKLMTTNPAADLGKVRRPPTKRRALTSKEVVELLDVVVAGGNDPELDLLIVWAGLELGSRTGGLTSMTVGAICAATQTIELFEKGRITREQPATRQLITALLDHAVRRGGARCDPTNDAYEPDAPVLYYQSSTPERPHALTSRRMTTLHSRVQAALPWARNINFCCHELRHTSGTIIERIAGFQVAQLHLGHAANNPTDTYTKASTVEHGEAFSIMTGQPHPLAQQ